MKSSKLCNALESRIESYLDLAKRIRKDSSPDTVHDFRVASRYLLATEPLLRLGSDTKKLRKQVKKWLKSFTHLRDLHVFRKRVWHTPDISSLIESEVDKEIIKLEESRKHIGAGEFKKQLYSGYEEFCVACHNKSAANGVVYDEWLKLDHALKEKLDEVNFDRPATIHRLRIKLKPFRYLATFLHESGLIYIDNFNDFKYWQDIMGDIHDLEVVSAWLSAQAPQADTIAQLEKEAEQLRLRLKAEQATFRGFITEINTAVISRLLSRQRGDA